MEIYQKTSKDNLWTNNARAAFLLTALVGVFIIIFVNWLLYAFIGQMVSNAIFVFLEMILYILAVALFSLYMVQRHNVTRAMAFIYFQQEWYVIQLLHTKKHLSNSFEPDAYAVELKERRMKTEAYADALKDILVFMHHHAYSYTVEDKKTFENQGMVSMETKEANYRFLILKDVEVIEQHQHTFTLRFKNEKEEYVVRKFTNCFEGVVPAIQNGGMHV